MKIRRFNESKEEEFEEYFIDFIDYKDAILNWLVKFGWSHPNPKFDKDYPTLSMAQMTQIFNDGKILKNNCKIDRNKLLFLDKKWKNIKKATL